MKTVAEVIGVSRSNLVERLQQRPPRRIGRPPLPDEELVAQIKAAIAELPTYGYRRVHAILKRQALAAGLKPPNHKRVYRVMKRSMAFCSIAMPVVPSAGMTAASRSMNVIGAGVPMASRSAATMARECGSPSRSTAVTGKP
jgi:transposase InsO family protein